MPTPYIPIPGCLQMNVRFLLETQKIENVFTFHYGSADFGDSAADIWARLEVHWWNLIRPNISVDCVNVETYAVDLASQTGPVASFPAFATPGGAATGAPVPNNAALCITHRTAKRGRSYRGRTFIAGIAKSVVNGSFVQSDTVAALVANFNTLRTESEAADLPLVIASRYNGGVARVTGVGTDVTACVALDNVLDSQRRRTPGRGR
jgi:hypothetical protein